MRLIEAKWLQDYLSKVPAEALSPVLEIGSSSLAYRTQQKPHIEELIHAPLRNRGVKIITADLRPEEGVQIVGNIYDPAIQKQMVDTQARTLLLCNLLEHLQEPADFADICVRLVQPGGRIIVTVPNDFPYHPDPIDTLFRPGLSEIQELFPTASLESGEVLVDHGYWADLRSTRGRFTAFMYVVKEFIRTVMLTGGLQRAKSRLSRMRYLGRSYRITAAIMVLPTGSSSLQ